MINAKQIELGRLLFDKLKQKFPELEMVDMTESYEDPNHLWVNVLLPEDEEREIAIREMASEISMDILLEYGYHITISSATGLEQRNA
jgi:hypothetical protein